MLVTALDRTLPIYIETIGWNEWQEQLNRPDGHHCFHWLQTTGGEGWFECGGRKVSLSPNQGILVQPGVPNRYATVSHPWSTWYLTFNGNLASLIVSSLGLATSTVISWDSYSPLATVHEHSQTFANQNTAFSGLDGSAFVYQFLIDLKRYGEVEKQRSLSQHTTRLSPIIRYLEENYSNPAIGLAELAEQSGVSPQRLNALFRTTTGLSPYQYLIHLRIQKAKELLINEESFTVKKIATLVGFLDDSHFVYTFRKLENITPERYRELNPSVC
jgi:AraC family transcriptional regulator, arabinose operon regulatory protein